MKRFATSALVLSLVTLCAPAEADDVAPALESATLQDDAQEELGLLVESLSTADQTRLRGAYVAFAPDDTDPLALPACDDDGDYVVVLSHAWLTFVAYVGYAWASDHVRHTRLLTSYGPLLARAQLTGARLLPPPLADGNESTAGAHLDEVAHAFVRDALAFVVADELAFAATGRIVCPHPTLTHEHGDDEWTASEHAVALSLAPLRMMALREADTWAAAEMKASGRSLIPAQALLTVLSPLENDGRLPLAWSYLGLHPGSEKREAFLRTGSQGESSAAHAGLR